MPDKMRWRYGDTNPVVAAVDSDTVVEIGDLVWQDTDDAKPAASVPVAGIVDTEGLQAVFTSNFLGVAMQRSRAGETEPIRVLTTGVFEFDCPSSRFELGDLMGVWNDQGLKNQGVDEVSKDAFSLAIGRVAKRAPSATTTVLVAICSTVMWGIPSDWAGNAVRRATKS